MRKTRWVWGIVSFIAAASVSAQSSTTSATLGFESLSAWSLAEGVGALQLVPALSEGESALRVGGSGWRRVRSSAIEPGSVGESLKVDIALDANAAGWETVGVVVEVPAAGVYWWDLGVQSLSGATTGEVRTLTYSLPTALRGALQSGEGVFVNVTVNGAQAVTVDRLQLVAATAPPPPPSAPGCTDVDLEIVDIDADFRDIWAGREDVATGKRTSQFPTIGLKFNRPVDETRLSARVVGLTAGTPEMPSDCIDTAGDPIAGDVLHELRLVGGSQSDGWSMPLGDGDMNVPRDFNIVAFGNVDGIPDSWGPIAAGGDVSLQGFSVNGIAQEPLGIVVGGKLTATNGTIRGDIAHGSSAPQLQSVNVTGAQVTGLPFDFSALQASMLSL